MRIAIIIFCLVIISGSGYYSYLYSLKHFPSLKDYLKNEEKWHGREIVFHYKKVIAVGPGYFEIGEGGKDIKVITEVKDIRPQDSISFKGICQRGATIKLTDYYISKHRPVKYGVSGLAVFLVFLWVSANFKIDPKKIILAERNSCRTF